MSTPKEKTLSSKNIYQGRIINLRDDQVLLANGKRSHREVVEHRGAVTIVALTKDRKIILIRQYRKPVEKVLWELPAGVPEKGETGVAAASRELEEETGFKAKTMVPLFAAYASPGYSSELIRYYLAKDLTQTSQGLDEDEMIAVKLFPFSKVLSMLKKGAIKDNKTILAILFVKQFIL